METEKKLIFQIESPLVTNIYNTEDNYKVVFNNSSDCDKNLCAIYFSSNEIYYPNTEAAFKRSIIEKNKFEWQRSIIKIAHKHIFFRDVQKQWYIEGISKSINTPKKLEELILHLTKGYKVYAIGSSAGGYAAMVYGSLVNADRVYAFNAQFDLSFTMNKSEVHLNPLLNRYKDHPNSNYFQVDNFINSTTDYFYFQSSRSPVDKMHYMLLKKKFTLNTIQFKTKNHGFPFLRNNLNYVLSLSLSELIQLTKKKTHPFAFSVQIDGFFNSLLIITQAVLKRMKKKLYDEKKKH